MEEQQEQSLGKQSMLRFLSVLVCHKTQAVVDVPEANIVTPRISSLSQHVPFAEGSHIILVGWHCSHRSITLMHVTIFIDTIIMRRAILRRRLAIRMRVNAKDVLLHIAATKNSVPAYNHPSVLGLNSFLFVTSIRGSMDWYRCGSHIQ